MGVAILSGTLASLESSKHSHRPSAKWESHTPGTLTPTISQSDDSQPSRFIACVTREETAKRLRDLFFSLGGMGPTVEVRINENVKAVKEAKDGECETCGQPLPKAAPTDEVCDTCGKALDDCTCSGDAAEADAKKRTADALIRFEVFRAKELGVQIE